MTSETLFVFIIDQHLIKLPNCYKLLVITSTSYKLHHKVVIGIPLFTANRCSKFVKLVRKNNNTAYGYAPGIGNYSKRTLVDLYNFVTFKIFMSSLKRIKPNHYKI